jgi:LPS export ABC transporter permease LptF
MRILQRYVVSQVIKTFLISLIVFTFILLLGNFIRLIDMVERGVAGSLLIKLFLSFIPYLLVFSIPMAILTSSLLVFGRLSADNEITAMRACGIGFFSIFKSSFILGIILTFICGIVNTVIAPHAHYTMRGLRHEVGEQSPGALLEPGVFINYFEPYQFYIGQKEGNEFKDVIIYEELPDGRTRFFKGKRGEVTSDDQGQVVFKIYDVLMEEPPKEGEDTSFTGESKSYIVKMGSGEEDKLPKKLADFTIPELTLKLHRFHTMIRGAQPRLKKDIERRISVVRTEISERLVYTFCALAFIMIGMPLGITAHRGEKSIGAAISLMLVGINYAFIIIVEAFQARPSFCPYILVWMPNAVFFVLGPILTKRLSKS